MSFNLNNILNSGIDVIDGFYKKKANINSFYIVKTEIREGIYKISNFIIQYKGIYYCNNNLVYVIGQLIDFIPEYHNNLNIDLLKSREIKLCVLDDINIRKIENNINNNIFPIVNNDSSKSVTNIEEFRLISLTNTKQRIPICFNENNYQTNTILKWLELEPYIALTYIPNYKLLYYNIDRNKYGQLINSTSLFYDYNYLNDSYLYPTPKHKLTRENIEKKQPIHYQCNSFRMNDNESYFIEFSPSQLREIKNSLSLLIDPNPNSLLDGVYTYVIMSCGNNEPSVFLYKINTLFEIGTKHPEMVQRIINEEEYKNCENYQVYYAGELYKNDDLINILFNFNSGGFMLNKTTMRDYIGSNSNEYNAFESGIELVKGKFETLYNGEEKEQGIKYTNQQLIHPIYIEFNSEVLDDFKKKGALIIKFSDKQDCYDFQENYYDKYYNDINELKNLIEEQKKNENVEFISDNETYKNFIDSLDELYNEFEKKEEENSNITLINGGYGIKLFRSKNKNMKKNIKKNNIKTYKYKYKFKKNKKNKIKTYKYKLKKNIRKI